MAGATALVAGQAAALAVTPASASTAPPALFGPMTPALAAQLSKNVNQHVIVIMKSQLAQPRTWAARRRRPGPADRRAQGPMMTELRAGARHPRQVLPAG